MWRPEESTIKKVTHLRDYVSLKLFQICFFSLVFFFPFSVHFTFSVFIVSESILLSWRSISLTSNLEQISAVDIGEHTFFTRRVKGQVLTSLMTAAGRKVVASGEVQAGEEGKVLDQRVLRHWNKLPSCHDPKPVVVHEAFEQYFQT